MHQFYKHTLLLFIILLSNTLIAQITIGTIEYDSTAVDGYTLFNPNSTDTSYLIDNCGQIINTWKGSARPGLSVYFLEDGTLLRTSRMSTGFYEIAGKGGLIEKLDWNGNLLWSYELCDALNCQHHDIQPLPNGNILILALEEKTVSEAIAEGRDPTKLNQPRIWMEYVLEIMPIGLDSAAIVWEWHVIDHLVQDFDSTQNNYGLIADHCELFDFNYGNNKPDWLHFNAVNYNPVLDQIIITSRNWSELYVIDHSTTTQEAASHSGGNAGSGGDILFRWGNPITYQAGTAQNQMLFGPHDPQWIPDSFVNEGKIIVFNNGDTRLFSTVDIITPPLDSTYNYIKPVGTAYGPTNVDWTFVPFDTAGFFSGRISGAQPLPNGNILACVGAQGKFIEVDTLKNILWKYQSPVTNSGILGQGGTLTQGGNSVFRCTKYLPSYPGFSGHILSPGNTIESDGHLSYCSVSTSTKPANTEKNSFKIYPNPTSSQLTIELEKMEKNTDLSVFNALGQYHARYAINQTNRISLDCFNWPVGVYFVKIKNLPSQKIVIQRQ